MENRSKPRSKHYQFIMTGARTETRDRGHACMLGASWFEKKYYARKEAWFTTATVIGAISAFVDSIDSHIILRMICESKTDQCKIFNYTIVLYCIVLYCNVLYCIVLYCIVLYCIVLYCIVLYCIVLYCIVLYCFGSYPVLVMGVVPSLMGNVCVYVCPKRQGEAMDTRRQSRVYRNLRA